MSYDPIEDRVLGLGISGSGPGAAGFGGPVLLLRTGFFSDEAGHLHIGSTIWKVPENEANMSYDEGYGKDYYCGAFYTTPPE